ncbi:MAG TPA: CoA transferase [Pseudonocardia sp.]
MTAASTGERPPRQGALGGLRVLELGQIYNVPYCALLFAQLGADVIKLEPPGGERLRYRSSAEAETHEFVMLNSNKRSVSMDLKTPAGRELFLELVAEMDVVLENYSPGAMRRLGLDPELLCAGNPRLVYASAKGYGGSGRYADLPAMDITVQAMSGSISSTGQPDGPPTKAGPAYVDFLGGTHLYGAAVTALLQRTITGCGQFVEVSMHDTVYPTLASSLGGIYNDPARVLPERTGNQHTGMAVAPYNVYPAQDGWLAVISVSDKHFAALAGAIGRPELASDPRFVDQYARVRNVSELDAAIEEWTLRHPRWDAVRALSAVDVPCAPVLTVREVSQDPHLYERGMIREIEHPSLGRRPVPGCPLRLADSPVGGLSAAPLLGAHTDEVLRELCGRSDAELTTLRAAGVIR